jgi:hypothetical protein
MNWIKENKFLAGLLVVLVLGIGAFGYLLMGAQTRLAEATDEYERQVAERTRLHNLVPYPSPGNVKELQGQKTQASEKITELQRSLATTELPIESLTPVQFQDRLRDAVTEVKTLAGAQTKLKDKFFLAFDRYETATPDASSAGPLGRELKAIKWLVTRFIEAKAAEIKELERDPLPAEGGKPKEPKPAPTAGAKGAKVVEKAGPPLVEPHGIDLVVIGDPSGLRTVLNEIVSSKEQFYIPRVVSFKNEKEKAPSRTETTASAAPPSPDGSTDAAGGATPAPASTYIVGEEKVEMTLRLEMVDFAEVAAKPEAKGK